MRNGKWQVINCSTTPIQLHTHPHTHTLIDTHSHTHTHTRCWDAGHEWKVKSGRRFLEHHHHHLFSCAIHLFMHLSKLSACFFLLIQLDDRSDVGMQLMRCFREIYLLLFTASFAGCLLFMYPVTRKVFLCIILFLIRWKESRN